MRLSCAKYSGRRVACKHSIFCQLRDLRPSPLNDETDAGVAELADALDSKSSDRKIAWVQAPPPASSTHVVPPSAEKKAVQLHSVDYYAHHDVYSLPN